MQSHVFVVDVVPLLSCAQLLSIPWTVASHVYRTNYFLEGDCWGRRQVHSPPRAGLHLWGLCNSGCLLLLFQVTVKMEGGKVVVDSANYHHTVEIVDGKLVEVSVLLVPT